MAWLVGVVIIVVFGAAGVSLGSVVLGSPKPSDPVYQYSEVFTFGFTVLALFAWVVSKRSDPSRR